jgi:sulfatase maturation enzyme AslB (radical SAM superfamily)
MEERGQVSRREKRWDIMSDETKRCMELTQEDGELPFINYELFDIKFTGNKCNLRCYMCDAEHSSNLANERKKLGWYSGPVHLNPYKDMDGGQRNHWWEGFKEAMPFIKIINFTGGEPFIMDDYWDIIDLLIERDLAKDIEMHTSTNMTTLNYRGKSVRDYFPKFKKVHLQVSLDGYGHQYEWVRYPASYNVVIKNLVQVMGIDNVDLQVSITISALTIEALPKLYDHMKELGLEFRFDNVLYHPQHLQVSSLPMVIKDRLRPVLANGEYDDLVKLLDEPENLQHWVTLINYLDALDGNRGTDWRKTFPLIGVDIDA